MVLVISSKRRISASISNIFHYLSILSFHTIPMEALNEMRGRGITAMIHCKHVAGDIIKFYGVEKRYFHYSYPDPEKSKFGLEKINGTPHRYPFSIEKMKATVFAAAEKIGLEIYGGDCIVCEDGTTIIIDMNDFPSFTAVRDKAAKEPIKTFEEEPGLKILNGRYGPYISFEGKNYRIPKGKKPEALTLEECREIIKK